MLVYSIVIVKAHITVTLCIVYVCLPMSRIPFYIRQLRINTQTHSAMCVVISADVELRAYQTNNGLTIATKQLAYDAIIILTEVIIRIKNEENLKLLPEKKTKLNKK